MNVRGNLQTITRSSNQARDVRGARESPTPCLMFYFTGIKIKLSFFKYNILSLLYMLVPLVMVLQYMTDLN